MIDHLSHVLLTPFRRCDVFLLNKLALGPSEQIVGDQRGAKIELVYPFSRLAKGTEVVQSRRYAAFRGITSQLRRLKLGFRGAFFVDFLLSQCSLLYNHLAQLTSELRARPDRVVLSLSFLLDDFFQVDVELDGLFDS